MVFFLLADNMEEYFYNLGINHPQYQSVLSRAKIMHRGLDNRDAGAGIWSGHGIPPAISRQSPRLAAVPSQQRRPVGSQVYGGGFSPPRRIIIALNDMRCSALADRTYNSGPVAHHPRPHLNSSGGRHYHVSKRQLEFVTASDRIPVGVIKNMMFILQKNGVEEDEKGRLPSSWFQDSFAVIEAFLAECGR
ncbi:hypothetical protein V8F20_012132 [Naviculisporaceae sp. PSN 640]